MYIRSYGNLNPHAQLQHLSMQIFKIEPFFQGLDNYDQLEKITRVLGTPELFDYLEKYGIELDSHYEGVLGRHTRKSWTKYINNQNKHLCTSDALDLLNKMLVYDHVRLSIPSKSYLYVG